MAKRYNVPMSEYERMERGQFMPLYEEYANAGKIDELDALCHLKNQPPVRGPDRHTIMERGNG